jgi:predicted nucleic acid-binding Zn ribbon protein
MDIEFNCGWCGQHIAIDEAGAGLSIECPKCGQPLTVPREVSPRIVTSRKCPFCAEVILPDAIKCKHCGEFLGTERKKQRIGTAGNIMAAFLSLLCPGLGQAVQGKWLLAFGLFILAFFLWFYMLGWIIHIVAAVNAASFDPYTRSELEDELFRKR